NPNAVLWNTAGYAVHFGKTHNGLAWVWLIFFFTAVFDLNFLSATMLFFLGYLMVCLTYGFVGAQKATRAASRNALSPSNSLAATAPLAAWPTPKPAVVAPTSITSTDPIIGNLALSIYHLQHCSWVM